MTKTALVTGANRGIGLAFARSYAADGWRVVATCRDPENAADLHALAGEHPQVEVLPLDVSSPASIGAAKRALGDAQIDHLVNNAGVIGPLNYEADDFAGRIASQLFGGIDYDGFVDALTVNTFGPLRVAEAFIDNVAASDEKKAVFISSTVASLSESKMPVMIYPTTKSALNRAVVNAIPQLSERGVIALLYCPGHVKTGLGGPGASLEPEDSVAGLRRLIADASMADTGTFRRYDGATIAW